MIYYLEAIGVVLLALVGVLLGRWFLRLRKPYSGLVYVLPLLVIGAVATARRWPPLEFAPPFSWIMIGRVEFVALALACSMLLTMLILRLPHLRTRIMLGVFAVIAVGYLSVMPFLLPGILQKRQMSLVTTMATDGICLQSTHYTCGPAAAVTVLRRLEIRAQEGEVAVLARTNPASGTQPDLLAAALQEEYGEKGLSCEYRQFDSISELKEAGLTIALVKLNIVTDHHVAILGVTPYEVIIGDPLEGKRSLSHNEFGKIWRHSGIVLKRETKKHA